MEEVKKHEEMINVAPQYMRAVMKDIIIYPYTKSIIKNHGPVRSTFRYDGTVSGFSSVINETMYNVDIIAEGIQDLSWIILKELEYHFDDYGVGYFDSVLIAQHYGTIIGIAKTTNETVDWNAFKGRCIYVPFYEVKNNLAQRIEKDNSKWNDSVFTLWMGVIISLPSALIIICCLHCIQVW